MPSSPPDAGGAGLRQLTQLYDQAYEALAQGDLERVTACLQQAGLLLDHLDRPAGAGHADALAAHGRLQAALHRVQDATSDELAQVRIGRKALHGYARFRDVGPGRRLESRG